MRRITLLLVALMAFVGVQAQESSEFPSYIEVSSRAQREVTPNLIYLSITINERESKGRITVEAQERDMERELRALGIDTKTQLRVNDITSSRLKRTQAVTTKSYQLKLTDTSLLSDVYAVLQDIGITAISIEKVTHTDLDRIQNEVRVEAMRNARANAKLMAEAVDQTIGKAFYIYTYDVSTTVASEADNAVVATFGAKRLESAPEPVITDFRMMNVSVQVRVKFVLE